MAELGHLSLWLALAISLLQVVLPSLGLARRDGRLVALAVPAAQTQVLLALAAFGALTWCFVTSDFSVRIVASNRHTLKTMLY
jgi:cytochrome c-type biogenesis protein CcmF